MIEQFKPKKEIQSIAVNSGERILLIRLEDVSYFEAKDKYTFFMRVSRSYIVNTYPIKEIQKYFNGKFILILSDKNQSKIESGLKYGENIKSLISL